MKNVNWSEVGMFLAGLALILIWLFGTDVLHY